MRYILIKSCLHSAWAVKSLIKLGDTRWGWKKVWRGCGHRSGRGAFLSKSAEESKRTREESAKRAARKLDYVVKRRRLAGIFLHLQRSSSPIVRLCRYNKILARKGKVEQAAANTHTHTLTHTHTNTNTRSRTNERPKRTNQGEGETAK